MSLSYSEAIAEVTGPGQIFEVAPLTIRGLEYRGFVHAPLTLRDLFASARGFGDTTYLVFEDERWSFRQVMASVDALASVLVDHFGVGRGDRVAIGMRNYPEWVVAFAAITSIGAVSVSLNAWWAADELSFALSDSGAKVLIADRERASASRPACQRLAIPTLVVRSGPDGVAGDGGAGDGVAGVGGAGDGAVGIERWEDLVHAGEGSLPDVTVEPDDDATILYTSGTTGRPKGAVSTHRAILQALMGFACRSFIDSARSPAAEADEPSVPPEEEQSSFILIVPLFHVTGCVPVMLSTFAFGLKLVMMYRWSPERALELIERERVTAFVGVPTQSWDLIESPRFADFDTSSLRSVGGGGAPAPTTLVERVSASFHPGSASIGYGLTETNAYGPSNTGEDYVTHPSSTGRATPILQIEIRDPLGQPMAIGTSGEIWLKGPNMIRGYWQRPDATAETFVEGWLRTGDLGHLDEDGFLYVEDRAKDVILRAGENVYSAEVESALYEHPAVYEAAVFALPHERLGEEVAAAVVAKPGVEVSAEELAAHVGTRLAAFKVPTRVFLTEQALPRNAAGKILKRDLRTMFVD